MTEKLYKMKYYVDGTWRRALSEKSIPIYSPYDHTPVGTVPSLTNDEINDAVNKAKEQQPGWEALSLQERASYLLEWADNLQGMEEELAQLIMREVGKSLKDAKSEVNRTVDLIKYTVQHALHMYNVSMNGDSFPGGKKSKMAYINRVPLGLILTISPFNYPVNLSASKISAALITGNTVIFKPATQGALSGLKMMEALHQTSIPNNVCNAVTGKGSEIGDTLVKHPLLDGISFTGGTKTGKKISLDSKMIPLTLEMGGKDAAIVLEDAALELAASEIISGAFSYSGQRCTAIKRVIVQEEVADELVALLHEKVKELKVGLPTEGATIVPLINNKSADYVQHLIDDALTKGAALVTGNERKGSLLHPTLLDHVNEEMEVAWEEPFGPVLPVIRVSTEEEAVSLTNQSEYGLQASVFTEDIDTAFLIANQLHVGTVQINGKTERGPDHFPFLGIKSSGLGSQGVHNSIDSMLRDKLTVLNLKSK